MPLIDTAVKTGFTPEEMKEMEAPEETEAEVETEGEDAEPEPEVEPAKGKADAGKSDATGKTAKPPQGYVPQAALHEAREESKALKARMERMEGMWQRIQGERSEAERKAKEAEQAAKIPAFDQDPGAHIVGRLNDIGERFSKLDQEAKQRAAQDAETQRVNQQLDQYARHTANYVKKTPDYNDAYAFLSQARDAELQLIPGFQDPVARANRLQFEEGQIVGMAMHNGQDPADILYKLAAARGYKKAAPVQEEAKIDRLAKGVKAAKSLSGAGGASPTAGEENMTIAGLLELEDSDPDAAEAMWTRMKKRGLLG